jgi:predicted lipoprotein with Yx(FWY)xxD motif
MLKRALAVAVLAAALATGGALAATGGAKITLHKTSLGKVLATSSGMSLYLFAADSRGKSNCDASCATYWPPVLTKGKPVAAAGLKASLLGTIHRGSKLQVTYAGHPLYRFALDKKIGQTSGENLNDFGGHWFVVSAAGSAVKHAPASGGGGGGGVPPRY